MKKTLASLAILLGLFGTAQCWEEFPQDTPGMRVVDRDYLQTSRDGKEAYYYAVLYNGEDQTFLDIYGGLPWKRLYHWPVTFEGDKVLVRPRAALSITEEDDGKIDFYWNDYAGYSEGAVHLALIYDPKTGTFTPQWSD